MKRKWYLDRCCSRYMIGNASMSIDFKRKERGGYTIIFNIQCCIIEHDTDKKVLRV